MKIIVCSLFEKDYHFGVATLINSLLRNEFQGDFYLGYKGDLPFWVDYYKNENCIVSGFENVVKISIHNANIFFVSITDEIHFANYKPYFISKLFQHLVDVNAVFYFDPDIVVTYKWSVFKNWIKCGVALCEDINSPLQKYHPRRYMWREYFEPLGFYFDFKNPVYVNSGFIGITRNDANLLLNQWIEIQKALIPVIGSLKNAPFSGENDLAPSLKGDYAPFSKTDQDALNIAIETTSLKYSFIGKEAMGFSYGGKIMSHALGSPKPWNRNTLSYIIKGVPARVSDIDFWNFANAPIQIYPLIKINYNRLLVKVSRLVGRFYSKS